MKLCVFLRTSVLLLATALCSCQVVNDLLSGNRESMLRTTLESHSSDGHVVVLVPINLLGLANRLRIIASMYAAAARLCSSPGGRPFALQVIWQSSPDCPAEFDDLFVGHRDKRVMFERYERIALGGIASFEENIRAYVKHVLDTIPESRGGVYVKEISPREGLLQDDSLYPMGTAAEHIDPNRPIVVVVWTRGMHALKSMHCKDFLSGKSLFYQGLIPVPEVASAIERVQYGASYAQGREVIGVHVRAFDSEFDWAVVSPDTAALRPAPTPAPTPIASASSSHGLTAFRFDESSPLEAFHDIMQKILKFRPSVLFYIASNSEVVKDILCSSFPNNSVTVYHWELFNKSHYRSSLDGMRFALVEFYLLGEANTVIHSRGSSFAREGSVRRLRPTIDVTKNEEFGFMYFYSMNPDLPLCSLPEFIRETADLSPKQNVEPPEKLCYIETGGREMCTVSYRVCPCEELSTRGGWESLLVHCYDPERSSTNTQGLCTYITAESNGYSLSEQNVAN